MAPGTYTNAVKSVVQCRTRQSSTSNTQGPLFRKRGEQIQNVEHHEREWNRSKLPLFQRNNDKKNMFLIEISTLNRMLDRKILYRLTDKSIIMIAEFNQQLLLVEDNQIKLPDNTLDSLYDNRPNQLIFQEHVHTNVDSA